MRKAIGFVAGAVARGLLVLAIGFLVGAIVQTSSGGVAPAR